MPKIKQPILDVCNRLKSNVPALQTVRIFNNQIEWERSGKYPNYMKPAAFVEPLADMQWEAIGEGYTTADVVFRIHIVHEFYDAGDGSFEQDLAIFDIRDSVIEALHLYEPTGTGMLSKILERPDYQHDNLYVYIVDFMAHNVDDAGAKKYTTVEGVEPEINATFSEPKNYIIPTV